jgi:hypothetical protein
MADKYVYAIVRLINAGLLIWALAKHPIGYYTLVRLVTTGVCLYSIYICAKDNRVAWGITFGGIALLFQPIIPLRMTRDTWQYVDVIVAVFLVVSIRFFNRS